MLVKEYCSNIFFPIKDNTPLKVLRLQLLSLVLGLSGLQMIWSTDETVRHETVREDHSGERSGV